MRKTRLASAGHRADCPMDPCPLVAGCHVRKLRAQLAAARKAIRVACFAEGDYGLRARLVDELLGRVSRAGK